MKAIRNQNRNFSVGPWNTEDMAESHAARTGIHAIKVYASVMCMTLEGLSLSPSILDCSNISKLCGTKGI